MNDTAKVPYIKATLLPTGQVQVEMTSMTLLQTMGVAMILMEKVYDKVEREASPETAEMVGAVLQALSALVDLADSSSNKSH